MNREQAFQMIEVAKVQLLTEQEADELGAWAQAELAAAPPQGEPPQSHPLVEWITKFTKETRATEFFSPNFKKVNKTVMPHVVAVFELNAPSR